MARLLPIAIAGLLAAGLPGGASAQTRPPAAPKPPPRAALRPPAPATSVFGPHRYVLERVAIRGNRRTRADLIRHALTVTPGQFLDEAQVARSRLRILALGLFRRVEMRLTRGSQRGWVVLVVTVTERPSLAISDLFLGTTDVSPFYGGFGIADDNLLGSGLLGSAAFVVGTDGRWALRASLHDPGLLGSDVIAGLTATWVRGVEVNCPLGLGRCDTAGLDRLRYRRGGGILSVGLRTGRESRVYIHYRAEGLTSRIHPGAVRLTTPGLPLDLPPIAAGRSFLSTVAVAFETDTRDDPFIATRGTRFLVSAEVSSKLLFSDYDYSRYRVSVAHYFRGFADHSIRLHLFVGLVQGAAPFFDRFQVADHSFFTVGANTVPRALELSFTEISKYDDVLVSGDATYQVPVFTEGGHFLYRGYLYAAVALTLSAHTVDRSLLDLSFDPRNEVSRFPVSGDLGIRLDTAVGVFSIGLSYPLNLLF